MIKSAAPGAALLQRAVIPFVLVLLLMFTLFTSTVDGTVSCNSTQACQDLLAPNSECLDGFCTNPYAIKGCLANRVPGWTKIRVCNSEDEPNAAALGHCREPYPGLEYTEIRLAGQNWESAFFIAWIQQIILSELLDVPTTLESGEADKHISFYNQQNALDYGVAYPWDGLETAARMKDCRRVEHSGGNYTPCVHVMGEVWANRRKTVADLEEKGFIEPFQFLGVFAKAGWYVPRFTAARDPTLLTYLGLSGEENRRKLAETFLSPTTWSDYCEQVSTDNCTVPSNVTTRAPMNEEEGSMYFSEGLYTGHFRATDDNDCDANPTTCHGHFANLPCGWSTVFQAQAFHNNIALNTSGDEPFGSGYSYPRLIEIWNAANATKSNVIMEWWQPEALYQRFIGSDAEFQKVDLPPTTLECIESRIDYELYQCSGDFVAEQGSPEGACDDPDQVLMKLISTGLFEDPSIPEARRSPGYDVVNDFIIDTLQLDQIFKLWINSSVDEQGFALRDAICQWAADNLEYIQSFVPRSYPRAIQEDLQFEALNYISLALGVLAVVLVCASIATTYAKRQKTLIRFAQLDFLFLLLSGLLLVSIAAVITAVSNTNAECVSAAWLIDVGYTLELVPLIIKVYAINHLMQAAKHFRRVELSRLSLFGAVFLLTVLTVVFMICWTLIDPPKIISRYMLTNEVNDAGETIVSVSYYCRSDSQAWGYTSLGIHGFLLFVASVLAFQMRKLRHELNESQSLAILIYSHFIFWVLRLISFVWLKKSDFASAVSGIYSLILGIDSIASICIYFLPKFFLKPETRRSALVTAHGIHDSCPPVPSPTLDLIEPKTSVSSTGVTNEHRKKSRLEKYADPLHGTNSIRFEGCCPHCGGEIEQDLLREELEECDESAVVPLNCPSHDEEFCEETDPDTTP